MPVLLFVDAPRMPAVCVPCQLLFSATLPPTPLSLQPKNGLVFALPCEFSVAVM